jgi:acetyl-CoA carboxylase carboxyl transferase subunit beta
LIDTPGAANGPEAERAGVGTAIAELFAAVAACRVPITTLVVGEGGSGGALALASPRELWIVPDGYFAVIAPEGAAAILERDPGRAPQIAERMALAPADLVRLGVVAGIASGAGA